MKTCTHCNRTAARDTLDCLCGERFPLEFDTMPPVWTAWAMRRIRAAADALEGNAAARREAQQEAELGIRWTPRAGLERITLDGASTSPGAAPERPARVEFVTLGGKQ